MRATLCKIFAGTALWIGVVRGGCSDLSLEHLSTSIGCGSPSDLSNCLSAFTASDASARESNLRQCLESIGCSPRSASAGSEWIAGACEMSTFDDLRKRAADDLSKRAAAAATTAIAAATTGTSSANTCLATDYKSVTMCATITKSGSTSTSCTTTPSPTASCADGMICATATAGDITCMKRDDKLTTSGFVIAIAFSIVVAMMIGSMIFMCCRSRRDSRAMERARDSAFNAARKDVETADAGKATQSEAHLPLMAMQGPAGGDYTTEYLGAAGVHRTPSGTYQEIVGAGRMRGDVTSVPPVPKLHPGLMSAPGDVGLYDGDDENSRLSGRR